MIVVMTCLTPVVMSGDKICVCCDAHRLASWLAEYERAAKISLWHMKSYKRQHET